MNKELAKMGRILASSTIKQPYLNGFGMVEVLLVLMILGMISTISIPLVWANPISLRHAKLMVNYQVDQSQLHAIAFTKRQNLPFFVDYTQLYYNHLGNINQAKGGRLSYPYNMYVTFYLGYGRYEIQ
jgi:prepilin-type N-terminal cleavage/methylation domain-containing protein